MDSLSPAARISLKRVAEDTEVHYLVVLQPPQRDKKKILPSGPNLDFRTPADAAGVVINGMKATMYVDLEEARKSPTPTPSANSPKVAPKHNNTTHLEDQSKLLESQVEWLQTEKMQLSEKLAHAKARLITSKQLVDELKRSQETLKARIAELENTYDEATDTGRLKDIDSAEEELISRMNEFMEKEAELEQREENLFYRERILHEKENASKIPAG